MLITYFIFLALAVTFRLLHFPGASLLFLVSPLFPLIDILVQSLRKKGDKETRILSSIGVFLLAVFTLFKFLHWPGEIMWFFIGMGVLLAYLIRFFMKKLKADLRFFLVAFLILFSMFNFSLKRSSFTLTYLLEDPFDKTQQVPHFYIQRLAREFYAEGNFEKAERLIQRNVDHITLLIEQNDVPDYLQEIDKQNLEITLNDLEQIKSRSWDMYVPLYPEDRSVD